MTKPLEYYQRWADRLNKLGSDYEFIPQEIADIERLTGKPMAELSPEDFRKLSLWRRKPNNSR